MQGGPLPCFMDDSLLQKLFGTPLEEFSRAEGQVRDGLKKFGLVEVNYKIKIVEKIVHYIPKSRKVPLLVF